MGETDLPSAAAWIVVGSPDNFGRSADLGFIVQGFKSRHRKKVERMAPGDKLIFYLTGRKAFAAISTIESAFFESHERVWESGDPKKAAEDYPFRVRTAPDLVLAESDYVPAEALARQMIYAQRWPAEHWTLAFQGNLHAIGDEDYRLIRAALEQRSSIGAGSSDERRPV